MKKIYSFLMTVITIMAVSCNNDKLFEEQGVPAGSIRVNITVGGMQHSTKAVKTGWENGDIIHVYLDDNDTKNSDFDLTYDGTKWNASALSDAVVARLKATGGKLHGFWESSNSASTWYNTDEYALFTPDYDKRGTTGIEMPRIIKFQNISYSVSSNTLNANINSWEYVTNIQIVVSGISGSYTMYCDDFYNIDVLAFDFGTTITYNLWGPGDSDGRIRGTVNDDGLAFHGQMAWKKTAGSNMTLYLVDNTTGVTYSFTKSLTADISSGGNSFTAIKVPFNKFVVDMGFTSGTKWAACNLGADYLTGYGDYYAWGETEPYYSSQSPLTWKDGKSTGYSWGSYDMETAGNGTKFSKYTYDVNDYATSGTADGKNTLEAADDAATVAYGAPYRMPTQDDFYELRDNCTKEFVTNYLGSGVNGFLFTSTKTGFTNQKVFLPAAGRYFNKSIGNVGSGTNYWTSSVREDWPSNAWAMCNYSNTPNMGSSFDRILGYSIRPVR